MNVFYRIRLFKKPKENRKYIPWQWHDINFCLNNLEFANLENVISCFTVLITVLLLISTVHWVRSAIRTVTI